MRPAGTESDTLTVLTNGRILTPYVEIKTGTVVIQGRQIVEAKPAALNDFPSSARVLNLRGLTAVPGFVDMHIHGALGADTLDATPEAISTIARFLAKNGTTSFLPTTVSAGWEQLGKVASAAVEAKKSNTLGAEILGLHLEGPFLNPEKRGAQNPAAIQGVDLNAVAALLHRFPGLVRVVTLAPELPGALDCIKYVTGQGVTAAAGHTSADFATMNAAFEAGLTHGVHLFNGMGPLHHREPGAVGAILTRPGVTCEVIADGHHLHPATVWLTASLKAPDDLVLVTDAMRAAGLADGQYDLGGLTVRVKDGVAKLPTGSLAGSTLTLVKAVKNAAAFTGFPLQKVVQWATVNPARVLGVSAKKGEIAAGKDADITVLDQDFNVVLTMVRGTIVWDSLQKE